MAKRDYIKEIKDSLKDDKLLIGTKETIKAVKSGSVTVVFFTKNIPVGMKEEITKYCGLAKVEAVELEIMSDELGTICRKPYLISVLSIKKTKKD